MEAESVVTGMLALFRSDTPAYQPSHPCKPLLLEDGNPQASLENLKRLGLEVQDIWVRKGLSRVLIQFDTGEQYLALGLGNPDVLARIAAAAGYGDYEWLRDFYACLPPNYDDKLPEAEPRGRPAHGQDSGNVAITPEQSDPRP
jgi:hypothetical protein